MRPPHYHDHLSSDIMVGLLLRFYCISLNTLSHRTVGYNKWTEGLKQCINLYSENQTSFKPFSPKHRRQQFKEILNFVFHKCEKNKLKKQGFKGYIGVTLWLAGASKFVEWILLQNFDGLEWNRACVTNIKHRCGRHTLNAACFTSSELCILRHMDIPGGIKPHSVIAPAF